MWWKEFQARFESDEAFRAKFADVKTEDEFMARAKAEGYDFEQLSDDELDNVAGGAFDIKKLDALRNALQNGDIKTK